MAFKSVAFTEALESAENLTSWGLQRITADARAANVKTTEPTVAFFAEVTDGTNRDFVRVTEVKASDLYAFSDAPIIEVLNSISVLRDKVQLLQGIPATDIEFELQSVELWRLVGGMKKFFGISPAHDELIASLRSLGVGENALLDTKKLAGLLAALSRVADRIALSDNILDEFSLNLEQAGFDLDAAMASVHLE
jgi:hypothetical protein